MSGWIGVDLDGTLAVYDKWRGVDHIGEPIPAMVDRVKTWLRMGKDVRIFTARVCTGQREEALPHIERWCCRVFGRPLPVTCEKDYGMLELWDGRCVTVQANTGRILTQWGRVEEGGVNCIGHSWGAYHADMYKLDGKWLVGVGLGDDVIAESEHPTYLEAWAWAWRAVKEHRAIRGLQAAERDEP